MGTIFEKRMGKHFAHHLSDDEKKSIYLHGDGSFLWHLFSWEKRACLKEDKAVEAFNNVPKTNCYLFYQESEKAYMLENAYRITAEDFKDEHDNILLIKILIGLLLIHTKQGCLVLIFVTKMRSTVKLFIIFNDFSRLTYV